jgi:polar amino acid transport system substrate-binding protein
MKITLRLSALVLALALLPMTDAAARPLDEIKASGVVKIATEGATPPFNYYEDGTLKGFDVELGNAIAAALGVKAEWVAMPFDSLLVGLDQDRYDFVVAGHGITEERQKAVDFSDPYVCSGAAIVAREGGPASREDLAGKIIGVQVGTTYLAAVEKIEGVGEVKTFPKDTDALQNLIAGRTDVWVSDKLTALDASAKNAEAKLQIGALLYEERYGMAFKKGEDSLRDAVNAAFAAVLADGQYAGISQQYFGQDIRCQ